jgi:hypothetical protein
VTGERGVRVIEVNREAVIGAVAGQLVSVSGFEADETVGGFKGGAGEDRIGIRDSDIREDAAGGVERADGEGRGGMFIEGVDRSKHFAEVVTVFSDLNKFKETAIRVHFKGIGAGRGRSSDSYGGGAVMISTDTGGGPFSNGKGVAVGDDLTGAEAAEVFRSKS